MKGLTALCAAAFAAGALAGSAGADPGNVTVSLVACILAHGGHATVPAGSTVSVRFGWAARTAGLDEAFVRDIDIAASVDGTPVADTASYWGQPTAADLGGGLHGYIVNWLYPTGVTLGSGQSLTFVFDGELAHPITDGFTSAQGGGRVPAGDILGGQDTCTVTAS